jgi:hypothetical protein
MLSSFAHGLAALTLKMSNRQTRNPPPCRVIERFPREQFEAFAALLECVPSTSRRITPFAMLSIMRQQELIDRIKKLPHDRVVEVAEFVESLTDRRA